MSTEMAGIPADQYQMVTKFIVNRVREESKLDGDQIIGVRWNSLREWITEQIFEEDRLSDDKYHSEQKTLSTAVLKCMAQERILKGGKVNGHSHWVVHPKYTALEAVGQTSNGELYPSLGMDLRDLDRPSSDAIEVEGQTEIERENLIHADAYAEMTKLTIPPRPPNDEPYPDIPSNKRRRVDEIAESDCSNYKFTMSPPGRDSNIVSEIDYFSRRPSLPEDNQSVSAPSRFGTTTPQQLETPKRRRYDDFDPSAPLTRERKRPSPSWITSAVEDLQARYPNALISSDGDCVKCLDCDDREFNMTTKTGRLVTINLEKHLNGNQHKSKVAERIEKESKKDTITMRSLSSIHPSVREDSFGLPTSKPPAQCFSISSTTESTSVSSDGEPNLKELRAGINKYFEAVENDSAARRVRTTLVEQRLTSHESRNEEQLRSLRRILTESNEHNKEREAELEEDLINHKGENRELGERMETMILNSQAIIKDQASSIKQLSEQAAESELRQNSNSSKIDEIDKRVLKSSSLYYELVGRQTEFENTSEKETEKLANRVGTLEGRNKEFSERILTQLRAQTSDSSLSQKEYADQIAADLTSQVAQSEARQRGQLQHMEGRLAASESVAANQITAIATGLQEMEQRTEISKVTATNQILSLKQDLATLKRHTKETFSPVMNRVLSLERARGIQGTSEGSSASDLQTRLVALERQQKNQIDATNDLESQTQIHSDELQRHRDGEDALRQSLLTQINAHMRQTADRMHQMEKQMNEKIVAVERAGLTKIRELEELNKEQDERIRAYDKGFRTIFEEQNTLAELVQDVAETVESKQYQQGAPRLQDRGARRRTDGPRPV